MGRSAPHAPDCDSCRHFLDDYRGIEAALPGMTALSSALGSTRGSAGICAVTGRFHNAIPACPDFVARGDETAGSPPSLPDRNDTARAAAPPQPASGGHS